MHSAPVEKEERKERMYQAEEGKYGKGGGGGPPKNVVGKRKGQRCRVGVGQNTSRGSQEAMTCLELWVEGNHFPGVQWGLGQQLTAHCELLAQERHSPSMQQQHVHA